MGIIKHITDDEYDWASIGKRIKREREEGGLTQSELMGKIGRSTESYRVLGRWEKGTARPQFSDMIELCKVFDCELGYLLCEYDCRTGRATDIQKETGMSESAIETLRYFQGHKDDPELSLQECAEYHARIDMLSRIIETDSPTAKNPLNVLLSLTRCLAIDTYTALLDTVIPEYKDKIFSYHMYGVDFNSLISPETFSSAMLVDVQQRLSSLHHIIHRIPIEQLKARVDQIFTGGDVDVEHNKAR